MLIFQLLLVASSGMKGTALLMLLLSLAPYLSHSALKSCKTDPGRGGQLELVGAVQRAGASSAGC